MPAASRSQSSHAQPCSYASGARNSDASATRPVMTMSAPCASASAIGRAPRYAAANTGGAGSASNGSPVSRCANDSPSACNAPSRGSTSSPTHGRDLDAGDAERACGVDRRACGRGRVDAAGVGDDLRAAVGDERQRTREVRGQVARVAARLVASAGPSAGSRASAPRAPRGRGSRRLRRAARRRRSACRRRTPGRRRQKPEWNRTFNHDARAARSRVDGRPALGPRPRGLELRRDPQEQVLAERRRDELHADRQRLIATSRAAARSRADRSC